MTCRFEFRPAARRELRHSGAFHKGEAPGIGREFAASVRHSIEFVREYPLSGTEFDRGTRRRFLGRFPHSLIYLAADDLVTVVALVHHRREPGYWRSRLR